MNGLTNTDVVILAGGLGKRLASVTGGGQKILAEIDGKPFISLLIEFIASQGGKRFILCTGHGAKDVEAKLAGMYSHLEILFSREEVPLGTGGAIKLGSRLVKSAYFIAMNGDCFCTIDYNAMIVQHQQTRAVATIAVTQVPDARDYGTIDVNEHDEIQAFKEKQAIERAALINTGTYCLNRDVFDLVKTTDKFSIEYDFFPHLVNKSFYGFHVPNKFIDIGTPERYAWANQNLHKLM